MKRAIVLMFVLFFIFGCTVEKPLDKPTEKISCCNRTVAENENRCELVNPPGHFSYQPGPCDLEKNTCNITLLSVQKGGTSGSLGGSGGIGTTPIGGQTKKETIGLEKNIIEVPICSGVTTDTCVQSNCMAMVCGDFLYRPKPLQSMPTEEEIEAGAALPLTQSEEEGFSLYKADCKFFKMDENLSKLLERSGAVVNSFRFGIGSERPHFEDFERFRYYFPPSDKFCSINTNGNIDRYLNYLEVCKIVGAANSILLCNQYKNELNKTDPLSSISKYQCVPYTASLKESNKMNFRKLYPFLYTNKESNDKLEPNSYKLKERGEIDKEYYARALTAEYSDLIFKQNKTAPFECEIDECLSGFCNKKDYKRSVILKKDGTKIPVDCHYGTINERRVVVCASHTADPEFRWDSSLDDVNVYPNYQKIPVYVLQSHILKERGSCFAAAGDELSKIKKKSSTFFTEAINENWETLTFKELGDARNGKCKEKINQYLKEDTYYVFMSNPVHLLKDIATRTNGKETDNPSYYCQGEILDCTPRYEFENILYLPQNEIYEIEVIPSDFNSAMVSPNEDDKCPSGYIKGKNNMCYATSLEKGKKYLPAATIYFFNNLDLAKGDNKKIIGYGIGKAENSDLIKKCNMKEGKDYENKDIAIANPSEIYIQKEDNTGSYQLGLQLGMDTLREIMPYFNYDNDKYYFDLYKIKATSIPWVLAYMSCKDDKANNCEPITLTKPQQRILIRNNIFALPLTDNNKVVLNSEDLAREISSPTVINYVLASRYFYIIYSLGDCEMEEGSELPKLEEYGWCEPCTYATMAYSGVQPPPSTEEESTKLHYQNLQITNYLKNGIFPILDFRKAAEYVDLSQCTSDINGQLQCPSNVKEPWISELKLLVKTDTNEDLGPIIILVGSSRTKYMVDPWVAKEQTNKVKEICKKCLAAVPFYASASSYATEIYADNEVVITNYVDRDVTNEMGELFKKANNIDVAVIEFPIADVMIDYAKDSVWWNSRTAKEKADIVVERMYNYAWQINYEARKAGKQQPVPVVILFNLETNEEKGWPVFNSKDDTTAQENKRRFYADFFANIYLSKDKLRKAGVIGLVYTPLSAKGQTPPEYPANIGIVNLPTSFGSKFCSFQEGTYDFVSIELLNKINRITQPKEKCDMFAKEQTVQFQQICRPDATGWEGDIFNCTLTCYNQTDSCSLMCKLQKCTSMPPDAEHSDIYLSCEPPTTNGFINCMFKNGRKIVGEKDYSETALCQIKSPSLNPQIQQKECSIKCDNENGGCNLNCVIQIFPEYYWWKDLAKCFIDTSSITKSCGQKLSPSGAIYCQQCSSNEYCDESSMICDDGTQCVAPPGTTGPYKCPKGLVSEKCQLCSEKTGTVSCLMRRYTEPKAIDRFAIGAGLNYDSYFKEIKYSSLTDADMDIIARLPKTDKCCLLDDENKKYTYLLTEMNAISSTPVIFATGQPSPQASLLQDCGFIDSTIINAQGGLKICGITMTPDEPLACKKTGEWVTYDK
ncbi:MAG: hypothetical protein QXF35_01330 [Candidatus Bilamarchaeaceae archaeon]